MTPAIRSCRVLMFGREAGILRETESGYVFAYGDTYLRDAGAHAVSIRLPLRPEPFVCATLLKSAVSGGQLWDLDAPNVSGMTLERTNDSIRRAALAEGAIVADLAAGGERYASLDGIHPTKEGHATLARQWLRALGVR